MSYRCPSCGSDQTANVAVAQARETRSSTTAGIGVDLRGDVMIGGARTTETSAFGRSLQGRRVTKDESTAGATALAWAGTLIIVFGFFVATAMTVANNNTTPLKIGSVVCLAGFLVLIAAIVWQSLIRRRNGNPALLRYEAQQRAKWNAQWVCYQCGTKFMPEPVTAAG